MIQADKVTNLDYLKELAKGDTKFVKDMIKLFLAENPEEIKQLEQAIQKHHFELIRSISHHIKSTIPFVGLDLHINQDLSDIEKWATEKTGIECIGSLFTKVKVVCEKAFHELNHSV
jgi:hypothetical protein